MRKFFNSALRNAGCDSTDVEFWMGHSESQTKEAYFTPARVKLKAKYQKFVPFITIEKSLDISESEDYKRIKNENEIIRTEIALS